MAPTPDSLEARLALVDGILEGAFFSPLHLHDWLAFCCGQPALLGLEQDEMQDLFLRAAIACQTIYPELVEGRSPPPSSSTRPSGKIMTTAQPPGPGFPEQAPSL